MNSGVGKLVLAARFALRIESGFEKRHGRDAGDLDRVLKCQEHALGGSVFRFQLKQVFTFVGDRSFGDLIVVPARQDMRQCALARAVGSHDGMDLTGIHGQVYASQDRLAIDLRMQILDFEHCCNALLKLFCSFIHVPMVCDQPTEPSKLIPTSACASTANSIGNCCRTSLQKPLTINATAASSSRPRWRQ